MSAESENCRPVGQHHCAAENGRSVSFFPLWPPFYAPDGPGEAWNGSGRSRWASLRPDGVRTVPTARERNPRRGKVVNPRAPYISSRCQSGHSRKLFSRNRAMSTPARATVPPTLPAATKAVLGWPRASLRQRPASSSSSPRSPSSTARPSAATTTSRRVVSRTPLGDVGACISGIVCGTQHLCLCADNYVSCHASSPCQRSSCHSPPPRPASSPTMTCTSCQRRATSAPMADTAPRVFARLSVLGRVPSG